MSALKWVSCADRTVLLIPRRLPGIAKAFHLKPTRRCQSRLVETAIPSVLEPLHYWIGICLGHPTFLIKIEVLEDRFLRLKHESHTTRGLRERAQPISKRVGFVIQLGHFVPPVVNLREAVMRGWNWTGTPLGG